MGKGPSKTGRNKKGAGDSMGDARSVATTEVILNRTSRFGVYLFSLVVFAIGFGIVWAALSLLGFIFPIVIIFSILAGLLFAISVRITPQWERVAILRLGKFNRVSGPGVFFCIPIVEYVAIHVDQRIVTSSFSAEEALTADLVPVDVDAIIFWMVWDAKKACLEVDNYPKAVLMSAQTAMRDAIGQLSLTDISVRRRQIDHDLGVTLGEKCSNWGITVLSVEIRNIMIPDSLQDVLSREAQAERERNARIILAEVEKDISEMFVEAAETYDKNPSALQLRAMNLAYEGAKDGNGMILIPSSLAEGFKVESKSSILSR